MRPDLRGDKQSDPKYYIDKGGKEREFLIGEQVLVQNLWGEPKCFDGTSTEPTSPGAFSKVPWIFWFRKASCQTWNHLCSKGDLLTGF